MMGAKEPSNDAPQRAQYSMRYAGLQTNAFHLDLIAIAYNLRTAAACHLVAKENTSFAEASGKRE